ncbi:hypothetical protein P7C70_g6409, partial [Phenoliferia sp. Uapishka_3]
MAPSQAASSRTKRFFSTQSLTVVLPTLFAVLTSVIAMPRGPVEVRPTPNSNSVVAVVIFRFVDNRKQNITAMLVISLGHLPKKLHEESGLGMCAEEGVKGLDVVVWKKYGDPLELNRVWKEVLGGLPNGIVYTM